MDNHYKTFNWRKTFEDETIQYTTYLIKTKGNIHKQISNKKKFK